MNNYIELNITIEPFTSETSEIIIAMLSEFDFESFSENENGVLAYVQEELFNREVLDLPIFSNAKLGKISVSQKQITQQNWNKEWESNFQPICVKNKCVVRAPFHEPRPDMDYEIIIEPKMSFGTGHHATTSLMIEYILEEELHSKNLLDMGCGTGILAILAKKRGANKVLGIDIDEWAYENSIENIQRNSCNDISIKQGDADLITNMQFDYILANINRNILLNDIQKYSNSIGIKSTLIVSGFYTEDLEMIKKTAKNSGLRYINHKTLNNWVAAKFIKT